MPRIRRGHRGHQGPQRRGRSRPASGGFDPPRLASWITSRQSGIIHAALDRHKPMMLPRPCQTHSPYDDARTAPRRRERRPDRDRSVLRGTGEGGGAAARGNSGPAFGISSRPRTPPESPAQAVRGKDSHSAPWADGPCEKSPSTLLIQKGKFAQMLPPAPMVGRAPGTCRGGPVHDDGVCPITPLPRMPPSPFRGMILSHSRLRHSQHREIPPAPLPDLSSSTSSPNRRLDCSPSRRAPSLPKPFVNDTDTGLADSLAKTA